MARKIHVSNVWLGAMTKDNSTITMGDSNIMLIKSYKWSNAVLSNLFSTMAHLFGTTHQRHTAYIICSVHALLLYTRLTYDV